MFSPSENYINADKPKVDFVRLILERDVRVANHAAHFPVPGVYSPLRLCLLLSLFFVVKEITAYLTSPFTIISSTNFNAQFNNMFVTLLSSTRFGP